MRKRLKRRNILLDEVRKAYLSDLVASNAPIKKRASAINLQPMLALYAPSECTYELIHGEGIDHGGHVEIIHRESKHVADISKKVRKLLEVEQKSRLKAAKLEVRLQQDQNALKNQRTIYCDEREQLCAHVSMLKKRLNCLDESALKNSQQTIKSLQKKLEMSEAQVCDLVPLARDAVRSRHEANQTGILVVGKDRRIAELESRLERSNRELGRELERYSALQKKICVESSQKQALRQNCSEFAFKLDEAKTQLTSVRISLDEHRRSEVELRQKLSDLQVEYTEAMQREESEHEELQRQLEAARSQVESFNYELEHAKAINCQSELIHNKALKARSEIEEKLRSKHQLEVQHLKDGLLLLQEKLSKTDAKLKLEQEKRATIEAELSELRIEGQHRGQTLDDMLGCSTKINEILVLMGLDVSEILKKKSGVPDGLEIVKSNVTELLTTMKQLESEICHLTTQLDQYQTKSEASLTGANLSAKAVPEEINSNSNLNPRLLQNKDSLLLNADKSTMAHQAQLQAKNKETLEGLAAAQAELSELVSEDKDTRYFTAISQAHLSRVMCVELDSGHDFSHKYAGALTEVLQLTNRFKKIDGMVLQLGQIDVQARKRPHTAHEVQLSPSVLMASPGCERAMSSNNETPELQKALVSAVSQISEVLYRLLDSERGPDIPSTSALELEGSERVASRLVSLTGDLSSKLEQFLTELSTLRELANSLPENFSYSETLTRIGMLEQTIKELREKESGRKEGREGELQRLKQRSASQQNFIIELQEEVTNMKSLMFAADELKRQQGELEDRYRLLENEFTEKAEIEVSSRKARERAEMQLNLAQAGIASLTREKQVLTVALKTRSEDISKMELKLEQTQQAYEDMLQGERFRLETNTDVGIQHSPHLAEACAQTSFKTPTMTLRHINSFYHVPHRKQGPGSATPATDPGLSPIHPFAGQGTSMYPEHQSTSLVYSSVPG